MPTMLDALANEFRHGTSALREETIAGASRFANGAGRHGSFDTAPDKREVPNS